jgi:peroxiredoxin
MATEEAEDLGGGESEALAPANHAEPEASVDSGPWQPPPAQPIRILLALACTGAGAALYGFVLTSFWSSPSLGIHDHIPYSSYVLILAGLIIALIGVRLALGIWSPHAKLGISILAFFTSVVVAVGGGRFVSYTLRGTLNPPFTLKFSRGDRFPDFTLKDQNGTAHNLTGQGSARATLIVVYRGDFCPFARFELAELTAHADEFRKAGVNIDAISADPLERCQKLATFLHTPLPLLSDASESLLGPLGLVQHHRDGEPDNAIPAYFVLDSQGVIRWTFTSPYYREVPTTETLLETVSSVAAR